MEKLTGGLRKLAAEACWYLGGVQRSRAAVVDTFDVLGKQHIGLQDHATNVNTEHTIHKHNLHIGLLYVGKRF